MHHDSGLVYSTEQGRMCPECGKPATACVCAHAARKPVGDGIVRVFRETKGRKGKGVTVISGLPLTASELTALGRQLKKTCGSGGTVKDGAIEIQGDHCDRLLGELEKRGFTAKRAGG